MQSFSIRQEEVAINKTCISYMRDWFGVEQAPDYRNTQSDISRLELPFEGEQDENVIDQITDDTKFEKFWDAYRIMYEALARRLKVNGYPSPEYISAIGYRAAVTAMQEANTITVSESI